MAASLFSRIAEIAGERIPKSSVNLTVREVEIVNKIADGLSNKEIASQLYIEEQTVKNHVHNILDKLQSASPHGGGAVRTREKTAE